MPIALFLVLSALFIVIDPQHAALGLIVVLLVSARSLVDAWRVVAGTALRPALVWATVALVLAIAAQAAALAEPFSTGRPIAARFTYLYVLALLAALGSVLNARRPGGKAWAVLMTLLVVVFLIPWLEDQTRLRRAASLGAASSRRTLVDLLWAVRCGCGDELSADALRMGGSGSRSAFRPRVPRRCAASWLVSRRRGSAPGPRGRWLWFSRWRARAPGGVRKPVPISSGSGSGSATTGAWSGPYACSSVSIAQPRYRTGRFG